jgi:FKBP-type peptidyl-prolyl cis-trans isomerase FklB
MVSRVATLFFFAAAHAAGSAELPNDPTGRHPATGYRVGTCLEAGARVARGGTILAVGPAAVAERSRDGVSERWSRRDTLAEENRKRGEAYLAENRRKPGVKTLDSGVQYKVIKEGSGKSPKPTDTVSVHYRGTLIDGTEFDSSYKHGGPATFPVKGVIPGWQQVLPLMKEGGKLEVAIPSAVAYGESGAGRAIGPNETLLFEIELIAVK